LISTFSELDKVCKALGLEKKPTKKGYIWKGIANGRYAKISVHNNNKGKDIPTGTFCQYVRELGFSSPEEYFEYLRSI
jgi:hypothetical protein